MSQSQLKQLISNNAAWRKHKTATASDFFERGANGQSPEYLWIGCVDSRVPPERICQLEPGQMLTHRNVANQFQRGDINANAIIEFGIGVLKIPNVIVCGHSACGGINAGIARQKGQRIDAPALDQWVTPLSKLYAAHQEELQHLPAAQHADQLAKLSVKAQIDNICATETVRNAWQAGQPLAIHGLMYDLASGTLSDLEYSHYGEPVAVEA